MRIRSWDINLKVRLVGDALFNLLFWMYFPFITVYFAEALDRAAAGWLMTVPPLFQLAGGLLGGALADRLGRRPVLLLGAALQSAAFAAFAVSPSPWIDYAAFIGVAFAGAVYKPASSAMVADLVPEPDRRQAFATFATANNVGAVLGPALGAVFFFHYRQELLWVCAAAMGLYFAAIYAIVHETMPRTEERAERKAPAFRAVREQWQGYGDIFRDKIFLLYLAAGVFSLFPIMQLDLYLSVYISESVPAQPVFPPIDGSPTLTGPEIYGWLVGFNGLLFVLFILPVAGWFRQWKERDVFILSAILSGAGTFSVGLSGELWWLVVATIAFTFGEIVRSPVSQSFIARYAPEHARGRYLGADSLQYTIGKAAAPAAVVLSGWLAPMSVFAVNLGVSLFSALLYARLFRLYNEPQETESA